MSTYNEINPNDLYRDTRHISSRIYEAVMHPERLKYYLVGFIGLQLFVPGLWPLWIVVTGFLALIYADFTFKMPMRMPKDIGGLDLSDPVTEYRSTRDFLGREKTIEIQKYKPADGILYLGHTRSKHIRERGRECWITNSDARTHMFLTGTTGSGKTETLLGLVFNAFSWGSGVCYADGKADSSLAFSIWSMARYMGMEDNFLVLNYLTGGQSFAGDKNAIGVQSNTMNPFADGSADFLQQLLTSLLPSVSGDASYWQKKAINLMSSILPILCHKRDIGELVLSINVIRHYLALPNLLEIYKEGLAGQYPETIFMGLKSYFETGLPGFQHSYVLNPKEINEEVFKQHGYRTDAFSYPLSLLTDTYGFIFNKTFPDIDLHDVMINNRILVVLIPTLEKSLQETEALGKIYVSSIKLMMAKNLGYAIEGNASDVIGTKATNSPYPNIVICDEISFYFVEGINAMFGQARSLGFMMVAAAQDVQMLLRASVREIALSMIANTKVKWALALEDAKDTFNIYRESAGERHVSISAGHEIQNSAFASSLHQRNQYNIQKESKIKLPDLKKLNAGEGVMIFKDSTLHTSAFYVEENVKRTSEKMPVRINRFLQIPAPQLDDLPENAIDTTKQEQKRSKYILTCLMNQQTPHFPELKNPVLGNLSDFTRHLENIQDRIQFSPKEKSLVLAERLRHLLIDADTNYASNFPYHEPDYESLDLDLEDEEDEAEHRPEEELA